MIERADWSFEAPVKGEQAAQLATPEQPGVVVEAAGAASSQVAYSEQGAKLLHLQHEIVDGFGYSPELVAKFTRQPDGLVANGGRLVNAAVDFLDRPETPKDFQAVFDTLPVSLQTHAYEALWANPGASLEQLYAKIKPKLTLTDAAAADKAMARRAPMPRSWR